MVDPTNNNKFEIKIFIICFRLKNKLSLLTNFEATYVEKSTVMLSLCKALASSLNGEFWTLFPWYNDLSAIIKGWWKEKWHVKPICLISLIWQQGALSSSSTAFKWIKYAHSNTINLYTRAPSVLSYKIFCMVYSSIIHTDFTYKVCWQNFFQMKVRIEI